MPKSRHRRKGTTRPRVRHEQVRHPDCVACNDPDWNEDRDLEQMLDQVARVGWTAMGVLGDREHPPYTYTIGLSLVGHPELVIVGMAPESAYAEIGRLAATVLAGESLDDVDELEKPCGCSYRFVRVGSRAIDLNRAELLADYEGAIQCVWSVGGRYPGEPGYPEIAFRQPILGPSSWV